MRKSCAQAKSRVGFSRRRSVVAWVAVMSSAAVECKRSVWGLPDISKKRCVGGGKCRREAKRTRTRGVIGGKCGIFPQEKCPRARERACTQQVSLWKTCGKPRARGDWRGLQKGPEQKHFCSRNEPLQFYVRSPVCTAKPASVPSSVLAGFVLSRCKTPCCLCYALGRECRGRCSLSCGFPGGRSWAKCRGAPYSDALFVSTSRRR